jgi:putative ABC transport system ATP-binding protein
VLMVTHDPRILDVADRLVRMEDGRLIRGGPPGGPAGAAGEAVLSR